MGRILSLPTQDFSGDRSLVAKWTERLRRRPNARPLRPVQAEILETAAWAAKQKDPIGLFGHVGVGKGKTLAFWLLPEVFDAKRPILMLPTSMRKMYDAQLFEWSQEYTFRLPHVVYYSELSQPGATSMLRDLDPDLIMADEGHLLRHATSARTKRFLRYMKAKPSTRLVVMSGTMTGSGLGDYAHLAYWALRQYSFVPHRDRSVKVWGSVLNAKGEPDLIAWQTLAPLNKEAADAQDVEAMRASFSLRQSSTPGVVVTKTSSCDAKMTVTAMYPEIGDGIRQAMTTLKEDYALPNGLEIVDALHYHRAAAQISNGFYYVWDWPNGIVDEEWQHARRTWWSMCNWYLTRFAREGCDSPFLVEEYVRETHRSPPMWLALQAWDAQRHKPPPPTRPIWIDTAPVVEAYQWAMAQDKCWVWFASKAIGDMFQALGLPTFTDGSVSDAEVLVHDRAAISSNIFYQSRNFQDRHKNLVLEVPSSAIRWQQLYGRTHRSLQESDHVDMVVYQQTWALRQAWGTAMQRARYIQQCSQEPQKIVMAERIGFK